MAPPSVPEGSPGAGCQPAPESDLGADSPYGSHLLEALLSPRRSAGFRSPMGRGFQAVLSLLGRGSAKRRPEGPCERGWQRRGSRDRAEPVEAPSRYALRKTVLCPSRSHHSRRRLSPIPSRKPPSRQQRFVQGSLSILA